MRSLTCFILLALSTWLPAQEDGSTTREVYLRLLSFDTQSAPDKSFAFDPKASDGQPGVEAPIKTYLNHHGTMVKLSGNALVFSSSDKPEDAKKPEMQLASVNLPAKGKAFILIFLPVGDSKFKVLPLSDSVKDFPLGAIQVISLSKTPIKLTLEKKAFDIKPGAVIMIEDPPVGENKQSSMFAYAFGDGRWKRFDSGQWPPPGENKRLIQIFFDNPVTNRMKLRGFRDISPLASGNALEPQEITVP